MKRACIFVFFDTDGIVDDYNFYNLEQLKTVCDYLLIVVNGKLSPEGRERLADYADDMFVRHNEGYDSWAWKEGIEYIGWDDLLEFDELVLINDTMFGPLRPLKEVFDEMENEKCDFWGNNRIYEDPETTTLLGRPVPMEHKPEFVSSNLRVIRSRLLRSYEFRKFWDDLPEIRDYYDASVYGEWAFSYDMTNAGYTFQTLCRGDQRGMSPSPTTMEAFDQISRLRVPYIRKKAFTGPLNELTNFKKGDESAKSISYIRNNTDYDVGLIYKNLIRKNNMYDLHSRLSLTSILPKNYAAAESKSKAAVIFHAYYTDIFPKYVNYLMNFPEGTDIVFTVSEDKLEIFSEMAEPLRSKYSIQFVIIENRGRDVSAMLIGGRETVLSGKYDYICFMHDKKGIGSGDKKFTCIGDAYSETCFDNVAATKEYVQNVMKLFDDNPYLGLACTPPPTHAGYFVNIGGAWGHPNNYANLIKLLQQFKIEVPIDRSIPPMAPFGTVFWFRVDALRLLFEYEWKYDDFPPEPARADGEIHHALERAHPFFAQAAGYYTATIMNDEYASQEFIYYSQTLANYNQLSVAYCGKKWCSSAQYLTLKNALDIPDSTASNLRKSRKNKEDKNKGESIYVKLSRSKFKRYAKAIMPYSLWERLRKKKCEETGELYIKL